MKIRAIVKRPDEKYGHMTWISDTLENLQRIVGGYIEVFPVKEGVLIICNEEGKLQGLPYNCTVNGEPLVGDIIVVGENGEDFGDLPSDFEMSTWRMIIGK